MNGGVLGLPFSVVHDQLLCLADVDREVVFLAPHLPLGRLIVVGDQAYHSRVICKLIDGVEIVSGYAVVGEQGVQEGTKPAPLRISVADVLPPLNPLGVSLQEVQDPVAEGGVQSQGP